MVERPPKKRGFWYRHVDKVGGVGALLALLCCLGVPWVIALLLGVGLGFIINDLILIPLVALFLALILLGLYLGMRVHHRPGALILGSVGAIVVLVFLVVFFFPPLIWAGFVGVIAAIGLNAWYEHLRRS
ncbi:MAG: MerC family mercury resistance protein [Candidatus Obscuribacterales bacterium]